jgi:chromosome segregation ATPase
MEKSCEGFKDIEYQNSNMKEELLKIRQRILRTPEVSSLNRKNNDATATQLLDLLLLEIEKLKEYLGSQDATRQTLYVKDIDLVQQKISSSEKILSELQHAHQEAQKELKSVKNELQEKRLKEHEMQDRYQQVELELASRKMKAEKTMTELGDKTQLLESDNETLKKVITDLKSENGELQKRLHVTIEEGKEKDQCVQKFKEQNAALQVQLDDVLDNLSSSTETLNSTCKLLEQSKAQLESTQSRLQNCLEEKSVFLNEIATKIQSIESTLGPEKEEKVICFSPSHFATSITVVNRRFNTMLVMVR